MGPDHLIAPGSRTLVDHPHTPHMNVAFFKNVMKEIMIIYYHRLFGHTIFQQDGARHHPVRSVLLSFEDH